MKKIIVNLLIILSIMAMFSGCTSSDSSSSTPPPTPTIPSNIGDNFSFYETAGEKQVPATCRKVVSNISTNQGTKTLNIWVADNCWINGGTKSKLITQAMVDAMAEGFLKAGLDNDIYDWVTNICGVEWGSHNYPSKGISSNQAINILLCDIENDNYTTGGTLGYFWAGNAYLPSYLSTSNGKVMFVVDALVYANTNGDTNWSSTGYYPKIVFSTLAHEFQHMINFYQKSVVKNIEEEAWLDEMLAMSVEDLVAYKMFGSYASSPYYERFSGTTGLNACNYYSLCKWDTNNSYPYYAIHYGFGSYLLRHYDGANFVKSIYSSTNVGEASSLINSTSGTLDVSATISGTGAVLIDNQSHTSINLSLTLTSAKSLYFIFTNESSSSVNTSGYGISNNSFTLSTSVLNNSIRSSKKSINRFKPPKLPDVPKLFAGTVRSSSILRSSSQSSSAIESITGKSFSTLQKNWGAAYLLSDQTGLSGDFAYNNDLSSTINSSTYNLVEINAFTQGTPKIYVLGNLQTVNSRANVYYKAADNLAAGTYTITVNLGTNLKLTVVAK